MRFERITAHSLNFLDQTAALRFSPKWEEVRHLLAVRGLDAGRMILFWCDHAGGPDMCIRFALPDGTVAESIMRKDASSGSYSSIVEWRTIAIAEDDEEYSLARRIATTSDLAGAFAKAVESYNDFRTRCQ